MGYLPLRASALFVASLHDNIGWMGIGSAGH